MMRYDAIFASAPRAGKRSDPFRTFHPPKTSPTFNPPPPCRAAQPKPLRQLLPGRLKRAFKQAPSPTFSCLQSISTTPQRGPFPCKMAPSQPCHRLLAPHHPSNRPLAPHPAESLVKAAHQPCWLFPLFGVPCFWRLIAISLSHIPAPASPTLPAWPSF